MPHRSKQEPVLDITEAITRARELLGRARIGLHQRDIALSVVDELDRAQLAIAAGEHADSAVVASPLQRERTERMHAEAEHRRADFVYQAASTLFSSPLDPLARIAKLTALVVPDLADWCFCDLLEGDRIHRVSVGHWNPDRDEYARSMEGYYQRDQPAVAASARVLTTGRALVKLDGAHDDDSTLSALRVRSFLTVPLHSGHSTDVESPPQETPRTLGALTFAFAESNRRYEESDVALAHDLASRTASAVDNAQLVEQLQQALRARQEMVAVVSHDLKNPLASILLAARMLQREEGKSKDDPRSRTTLIVREAQRMNALIRDLLDVTTLEAGAMAFESERRSALELMQEAKTALEPSAQAKSIEIEVEPVDGDLQVSCDPARIGQVFSNLIGNALKFSEEGSQVRLRAERQHDDCLFSVQDSGPGIAAEHLSHIFDRYWQSRPRTGGAGLGLSIVKGIVERHGGTVTVASELGRGTCFRFTLPLVR